MDEVLIIILYSFFSGVTVFLGGFTAHLYERLREGRRKEELIHGSIAFGGGVLVAAVAFVLVPPAVPKLTLSYLGLIFLAGAGSFCLLDRFISRQGGTFAQLMAMLMDFVPEAISLGAVFAHDSRMGLLLAIFIGLQNFPEAFNSYHDLRNSGYSGKRCLLTFAPLSFIGIFAALLGNFFLSDQPVLIASLMLFSAGGILYLVFQDIAPLSKLKNSWVPALGATLGFFVGMVGDKLF
ncbi:MAG: divalent cation transporter [Candidatus Omnitrophica bacterium]|nr:divalent cation transporter [Candidatus Omnitrophota bacterium]MBD3269373.1 divalent cation transporter [Candidatus Omnitrophota bacterium]